MPLCVRWYLAYNLGLRDLKEMMAEPDIVHASNPDQINIAIRRHAGHDAKVVSGRAR